jgi:hypothetical protein
MMTYRDEDASDLVAANVKRAYRDDPMRDMPPQMAALLRRMAQQDDAR